MNETTDTLIYCADIAALPPGAIVTTAALQRAFGLTDPDARSIKNMVDRGELPPPAKMRGGNVWTAGALVRHWEKLMERAAKDADEKQRTLKQHTA